MIRHAPRFRKGLASYESLDSLSPQLSRPSILPASYGRQVLCELPQVSWCKLELEVSSSKNISSAPAQSRQDTPPLAVAALNLKIAVNPQVHTSAFQNLSNNALAIAVPQCIL